MFTFKNRYKNIIALYTFSSYLNRIGVTFLQIQIVQDHSSTVLKKKNATNFVLIWQKRPLWGDQAIYYMYI